MNMLVRKNYTLIPCGKCIGCRLERRRQLAIRATLEARTHLENIFATLTYADDNLVIGYQHPTLVESHLRDFWKRLRQAVIRYPDKFTKGSENEIRYLASGEYGDVSNRPHYHALIFGMDFADKQVLQKEGDHVLYHSPFLDDLWGHGYCTIGAVTYATASYVAKYTMKNDSHHKDIWNEIGVEPQFMRVSRRPGLGFPWLEKHHRDVYPSDEIFIDGEKYSSVSYFDRKYSEGNELLMHAIKQTRKLKIPERDSTKKMNKIKQTIKLAQLKTGGKTKL